MGYDITVRRGTMKTTHIHFAGTASMRQQHHYGISFTDCLTYGPDGDAECLGAISSPEGAGYYRPRVKRCIERAERLLAAVKKKPTHTLDEERVTALLDALREMKTDRKAMMKVSW